MRDAWLPVWPAPPSGDLGTEVCSSERLGAPSLELRSSGERRVKCCFYFFCLGCIMRSFAYCSVRSIKMNF